MPPLSRALRDWIEILSSSPDMQIPYARLVELNSRLQQLNFNWTENFATRFSEWRRNGETTSKADLTWKGVLHQGVVLVPLTAVVDTSFTNFDALEKKRISALIDQTQPLRDATPISTRLPGLKYLHSQIEKTEPLEGASSGMLCADSEKSNTIKDWFLLRRALARNNWLSAKVGDDMVPHDGLVQAVISRSESKGGVVGLDALVPLRKRRLAELLGPMWEETYYSLSLHDTQTVKSFVNYSLFEQELKKSLSKEAAGLASRAGGPGLQLT
jgi:hypothetical protein